MELLGECIARKEDKFKFWNYRSFCGSIKLISCPSNIFGMARYSKENALYELKKLESKLLSRAEKLLRDKNVDRVAGILISIDNEIYQTEMEARRLRLMGRLDYEI